MLSRDRSLRWLAALGYGLGLAVIALAVQHDGGRSNDVQAY